MQPEAPHPRFRRRPEIRRPVLARIKDLALGPIRVTLAYPGGVRRFGQRVLVITAVDTSVLWLLAAPLPGVDVPAWPSAFGVILVAALISVFVRPVILFAAARFGVLAFVLTIGLNAVALLAAAEVVPGAQIAGVGPALLAALAVAIGNTVVTWLLSLNGDDSFYGYLRERLARDEGRLDEATTPGILFIQVDGLATPVLESAVRTGRMPFVAALLRSGSHRLVEWRCQVPSMTSASQAGILLGNDDDIPAFRWYEKEAGRLVVSNNPADAAEMERRLGGTSAELLTGGTSVSNLFSGGAARSVLTASTLDVSPDLLFGNRAASEFYTYLVDPYSVVRGVVMTVGMIFQEWYQARRERARDIRPRMHRGGLFPVLRAVSSILLRDLATSAVIEDLQRGAPSIYVDLLNYDEIAHHAAPERGEAMRELEAVDRQIRTLVRAARTAPRSYRVVILSDHGQSVGPTFRDRTGVGLDQLVAQLMAGTPGDDTTTVAGAMADVEGYGRLNALLTSVVQSAGVTGRTARRALRPRIRAGSVELGPATADRARAGSAPDVVVCASGNLALVFFTEIPGRATLEEIDVEHPGLVARLATSPGIGFVLVRSAESGPLVVGRDGVCALADGSVTGADPLAPFGDGAVGDLRRLDAMSRVGDLVVNSEFDPATGEVFSFEPLIGCHGGLGGSQTRPFLIVPSAWDLGDEPLVGGVAVNRALRAAIAAASVSG
ncbi:MAG TPA: phage holin family protein [Candidatus Eisenbacteria bacterium]|nr:phage holin family protein [Candidatus Eisenbacteria bacterium]